MQNITPVDNNHPPLYGERFLCLPYAVSYIVKSKMGKDVNVYSLADFLGIVLPYECNFKDGSVSNVSYSNDVSLYGVRFDPKEISGFFAENGIGISVKYMPVSTLNELTLGSLLGDLISNNVGVLCGFEYGYLNDDGFQSGYKHVGVVNDTHGDDINIWDPEIGFSSYDASDLYRAMQFGRAGLMLFSIE